jgi:hypothetical protein
MGSSRSFSPLARSKELIQALNVDAVCALGGFLESENSVRFPDQSRNAIGPLLLEADSSNTGRGADSDSIAEHNTRSRQVDSNRRMLAVAADSKHLVAEGCNMPSGRSTSLPTAVLEPLCTTFQITDTRQEQSE